MHDNYLSVEDIRKILAGPVDFKQGRMLRRRLGELATYVHDADCLACYWVSRR